MFFLPLVTLQGYRGCQAKISRPSSGNTDETIAKVCKSCVFFLESGAPVFVKNIQTDTFGQVPAMFLIVFGHYCTSASVREPIAFVNDLTTVNVGWWWLPNYQSWVVDDGWWLGITANETTDWWLVRLSVGDFHYGYPTNRQSQYVLGNCHGCGFGTCFLDGTGSVR